MRVIVTKTEAYKYGELNEEGKQKAVEHLHDINTDHELSEGYRVMLASEYDYLSSEEAIIETIEANDYDFTAEGKLI